MINENSWDDTKHINPLEDKSQFLAELPTAEVRSFMLSAIVDSSDDAIISKNLHGIVTSWNISAERIFGYTAPEMIGQSMTKLIPAERQEEEPQILMKLARGERIEHFRTKRITKSGRVIDVSLTISPIRDKDGTIIGVSKIARDVTEHVHSEGKSAMLAAIIESTSDAIISKDLHSKVTSWNKSAERIFGYTQEEILAESITILIPPDRKQEESAILTKIKNGERLENFETKRITKFGKLIDVSLTISPIRDKMDNIIGISQIARDITERKKEEQQKNDFVSMVSHELKTPLTTLRSYIQLALLKVTANADAATRKLLVRAETQTSKMSGMIHDFLNMAKVEEGKMTLNCSVFSLNELIEEVAEDARMLSPGHHIDWEVTCELSINADRDKIYQVLTNLVTNAIKYSSNDTTVLICCRTIDSQVAIEVHDQGIGIGEADQLRLFERFYRVQDENIQRIAGFGIGLYLVSELLRLHGSSIMVSSKLGEGSVFSFVLPIYG